MKKLFLSLLAMLLAWGAVAQQNTSFREGDISSPVVNPDGSVSFVLKAPKAKKVEVIGDWEANQGRGKMKKEKGGIWRYTTPVLPSEMYTYRFSIDGVVTTDPTNPFVRRDVGNLFSIFFVGNGVGDLYQVQKVPHGAIQTCWYHSRASKSERRMLVYTPAGYADSHERYPVLYLLHGSGGDENAWVELGNVARIMDNLMATGKVRPMIVVMPNGNISQQAAPSETSDNLNYRPVMSNLLPDNYKNGRYEMSFEDIIEYTDRHFRTLDNKKNRAIAGLSMGGFHTLMITLNHPKQFDYIGLFSAGLNFSNVNMDLPAYRDMEGKLHQLKAARPALFWIGIGKDDFLYDANTEFRGQLDQMHIPYKYVESSRGHLWSNWRQYLVEFSLQLWK